MEITLNIKVKASECKRGKELEITDNIKELIKDNIWPHFNDIVECLTIDGLLNDVLIEFDDVTIKNIQFNEE